MSVHQHHGRKPSVESKNLNVNSQPSKVYKIHNPSSPSQDNEGYRGHVIYQNHADPAYVQFSPKAAAGQAVSGRRNIPIDPRIPNPKINNLNRSQGPRNSPVHPQMAHPGIVGPHDRTPIRGSPHKEGNVGHRYVKPLPAKDSAQKLNIAPSHLAPRGTSPLSKETNLSPNDTSRPQEMTSSQKKKLNSNARTPESRMTYLDSVV